jgi:GNAT superfamily N-acetyltransferase
MTNEIEVRRVDGAEALALSETLAEVLIDCVEGGASVSFILPLPRDKAIAFWRRVAEGVAHGRRALLVARDAAGVVLGTAQLVLDLPDNQPHRADVAKMLVRRNARRRGVARRLLQAVDEAARAERRTVLVLDTETGSDAERLYEGAGWQRVGSIPNYALKAKGGYCATTFFHKQL